MAQFASTTDDVEKLLLPLLASHQRGDLTASEEISNLLALPQPLELSEEIVPLLIAAFKAGDDTIREAVGERLASFEEKAVGAVGVLLDVALEAREDSSSALAAIRALGKIPDSAALEALLRVIESVDMVDSLKFGHVLDALSDHLDKLEPLLPRVERKMITLFGESDDCVRHVMNDLRCRVRWREFEALAAFPLPGEFDFTPEVLAENGLDLSMMEVRELPSGYGKVADGRIRFYRHGHGDAGFEIYHLNTRSCDRYLVILSEDGKSGVAPLRHALGPLASVILAMYDLDPDKVVWAERIAFESGLLEGDEDEYSTIDFQVFSPSTGMLEDPVRFRLDSRDELFR